MNRDELLERLRGQEWNDIEFKEARNQAPRNAYESVSAFANTSGGWLVFGVAEQGGHYEIRGLDQVDRVQNEFLSAIREPNLFECFPQVHEHRIVDEGKTVLAFYVQEARRHEKPICPKRDLRRSYIRRGGCDQKCSTEEIARLLRDAAAERYDAELVDFDLEQCFDPASVQWYRRLYHERNDGEDPSLSDLEFLNQMGLVVHRDGVLRPRRASVLLFGTKQGVLELLPRPIVDCQWIDTLSSEELPDQRWRDRVVVETNLIQAWQALVERYQRHAERPFSIDPESLQRADTPPDYITFREAAINLLIHQDFGDQTRVPTIQFFRDRTRFWNPGDAFASSEELLEPGAKEVRNPTIVACFRRVGLSEQAGTGIGSIFRSWRRLGNIPPRIENDKARKAFELLLVQEELVTEEQTVFQAQLGVRLDESEAATFALACRQESIRISDVRAVTGLPSARAQAILERLVVQALLTRIDALPAPYYHLLPHLRAALRGEVAADPESESDSLVSDQPGRTQQSLVSDQALLRGLNDRHRSIIQFCEIPRSSSAIMEHLGVTHRAYFRRAYLGPLIQAGFISMLYPDQPNHPNQAYVLTETGAAIRARQLNR